MVTFRIEYVPKMQSEGRRKPKIDLNVKLFSCLAEISSVIYAIKHFEIIMTYNDISIGNFLVPNMERNQMRLDGFVSRVISRIRHMVIIGLISDRKFTSEWSS